MNKPIKVLITSGGTKIKIDMVRHIGNMSRGTFGSKIADAFCDTGREIQVTFLMAKGSRSPEHLEPIPHYYETFDDYEFQLFGLIKHEKPDIIILAAAVSDYGVENFVDGKIRSSEELVIRLKPLPKLISFVRNVAPKAVICGFKLLVNSTEAELDDACRKSLEQNRLDLVVGNDLRDIKASNHILRIFQTPNNCKSVSGYHYEAKDYNLAEAVRNHCLDMYNLKKRKKK